MFLSHFHRVISCQIMSNQSFDEMHSMSGLETPEKIREDPRRGWEMRKSRYMIIYVKGLKKFHIRINQIFLFPHVSTMFLSSFVCLCFLSHKLVDVCQQIFVNARYSSLLVTRNHLLNLIEAGLPPLLQGGL